jgi:hypothetical protein
VLGLSQKKALVGTLGMTFPRRDVTNRGIDIFSEELVSLYELSSHIVFSEISCGKAQISLENGESQPEKEEVAVNFKDSS